MRWRDPKMIFANSMSDLFHKEVPFHFVDRVFDTMEKANWHKFQILTKRSSRLRNYVNARYGERFAPSHIWLGTSIEDGSKKSRVDHIQATNASVRFLSIEPLLGPLGQLDLNGIHWVIVGGESGPHARPMLVEWAREVRDQCKAANVPFFFKQWGGLTPKSGGRLLDGREWSQWPMTHTTCRAAKGGHAMAAPTQTTWPLEPHTRAKHEILKRYLQAWMVILSQGRFPEILYIDGFAGPGQYKGGEAGSPIIALDTALGFKPPLTATVHFLFVEERKDRADYLRQQVASRTLPTNFRVVVEGDVTFESAFNCRYSSYVRHGSLIPTFAFIDPFGWTGAPFSVVKRILSQRNCEVFVNFMYEEINRFIGHPDQVDNFNSFFGADEWEQCARESEPRVRNRCLHDLYMRQLRTGAAYVRSFEMSNARDVTDYYLFYATNSLLGLKKMKEAMWKADESGEFRFSDATNPNQLILFGKAPHLPALRQQILTAFSSKDAPVREVETFVLKETAFRETHYKGVLKTLEAEGKLTVINAAPGRRAGTFGNGAMMLRFT